ncbi:hypothetical protein HY375_03520 [Candidatus Berkelbacteria bacterium]|nr:hypothetical protein [Candidatus Berkelbacteria bacterium]
MRRILTALTATALAMVLAPHPTQAAGDHITSVIALVDSLKQEAKKSSDEELFLVGKAKDLAQLRKELANVLADSSKIGVVVARLDSAMTKMYRERGFTLYHPDKSEVQWNAQMSRVMVDAFRVGIGLKEVVPFHMYTTKEQYVNKLNLWFSLSDEPAPPLTRPPVAVDSTAKSGDQ